METLGTYRLISRLGAGGMGEVWRAEDTKLLRPVAIKILPASLAADPEWKDRFLREARTIAQLNHPNIATIYNIDQQGETLFIAMELVEGEPLSTIIARGPMPAFDAVCVAAHVAEGLSEAHAKGIAHRDIKPDNIIISPRAVKLLDFGIAKQIGGTQDASLTQGGMVVGTPHYMSPEQALGRAVDTRTDIFSLGVVLYEMLTGKKPFEGEAVTEILLQIVMSEPPDVGSVSNINPVLADIVRCCMKKQASDRFENCTLLRQALLRSLELEPNPESQSAVPTVAVRNDTPGSLPSHPPTPRPAPPSVVTPQAVRSSGSTASQIPAETSARTQAQPQPPASVSQPSRPRYRALVADDDPATRYILGSILSRHEIAFDEAENGAEAVRHLKQNDYNLVFLDLLMPRIDGWGVIDFLRTRRSGKPPRIFVVTGVQNQKLSTADQDVVAGMLYKPINIDQVERIVSK